MDQPRTHPKILLVEGKDDKFVILNLMKRYVAWGETESEWVVQIESFDGVEDLLRRGVISTRSKERNRQALGIIIDADDQRDARWASVSQRCREAVLDFPKELPSDGLIHVAPSGLRIGVWIMPDNQATGMLETFLGRLVPSDQDPLWAFAKQSRIEAKKHGASHSDAHCDKADIHTFLAWVDPPGQQLSTAVMRKSLDARTPLGLRFARWFVDLFQIPSRDPVVPGDILDPTPG